MSVFYRQVFVKALLTAILLRALMPIGYMPGNLSDGLLFELCPDGLPASVVAVLTGQEHHHHHSDGDGQTSPFEQCDFGHLCTPAAAGSGEVESAQMSAAIALANRPAPFHHASVSRAYSARAPPVVT